ncbi:MAG: hypothetical protein MIO93_12780 [ANME-2 cluster archaeon]|nr:hypothetical protein [ANME-2 cluster archaeon]
MRKIILFGTGAIVVLVVLAGLWMYHTHELKKETYSSTYSYDISMQIDSVLTNVTLFLPLPALDGESKIGDSIKMGWGTSASKPDDWECSIVDTEHGEMLKVSADRIAPVFRSLPVPIEPGEEPRETGKVSETYSETTPVLWPFGISVILPSDYGINTIDPLENEPMLYPRHYIYADYKTAPDTKVSLYIRLEGRNEWWVYGWSGDQYGDSLFMTLYGEKHGWYQLSGPYTEDEGYVI